MEKEGEAVLFELPHIRLVRRVSGLYCLIVEDTELNDYVEDFLWDDFEYATTSVTLQSSGLPVYTNCFGPGFPVEPLLESLRRLDAREVEQVYRRNKE
ncbi:MAG TPA: hypothetical protein VHK69_05470 [Chitinophagaceae bacterium]|jgi:hypothetical protein|nr:hypothetical protein [Chitinophagaceae bacterium]